MTYELRISKSARKSIDRFRSSNPTVYRKIFEILDELMQHPREGTGHPEPLRGGGSVTWSRRLTKKDRIIYDIHDNIITVDVITIGGHYGDK